MEFKLDSALGVHRQVAAELDRRETRAAECEATARNTLEECAAEREKIAEDRRTLEKAEQLYRRALNPTQVSDTPEDVQPNVNNEDAAYGRQKRARIGDQRYRIMAGLRRANGTPVTETKLSHLTGLHVSRIKFQLRSEVREGFAISYPEGYKLTDAGIELMDRFETYRKSNGIPLPSHGIPTNDYQDADGNGVNSEHSEMNTE